MIYDINYDIIIIGGGISGLNTCYQLLLKKPYLKILVLEKNDYLGGRIKTFTKKINNHIYRWEEGAGRLNDNHKLLLNLIDHFGLTNNLSKISSEISFYPSSGYNTPEKQKFINKSPFIYINKVIKFSKNDSKDTLQKYTFKEYSKKILNKDEIQFILDSFGYYAQLIKMNAYDAIRLFHTGMNPKLQFYYLNPGFDTIIHILEKQIIEKNGHILSNTDVLSVQYEDNQFKIITSFKKYTSKVCVLAIPKPELLKFKILNKIKPLLNSIGIKSLCRIYSVFKKDDIWFKDIGKSTTNNKSRYIIPIDKENGLIMISYSDSKFADYWINLYKINENLFINTLKNNIYNTFHKKINDPIYIKPSYWKCAVGFWKKNKDSTILSKKIIKPYSNISLFICGENYSTKQGWIEGALETSNTVSNLINHIFKKFI